MEQNRLQNKSTYYSKLVVFTKSSIASNNSIERSGSSISLLSRHMRNYNHISHHKIQFKMEQKIKYNIWNYRTMIKYVRISQDIHLGKILHMSPKAQETKAEWTKDLYQTQEHLSFKGNNQKTKDTTKIMIVMISDCPSKWGLIFRIYKGLRHFSSKNNSPFLQWMSLNAMHAFVKKKLKSKTIDRVTSIHIHQTGMYNQQL